MALNVFFSDSPEIQDKPVKSPRENPLPGSGIKPQTNTKTSFIYIVSDIKNETALFTAFVIKTLPL